LRLSEPEFRSEKSRCGVSRYAACLPHSRAGCSLLERPEQRRISV
jgi:hypothetical protein